MAADKLVRFVTADGPVYIDPTQVVAINPSGSSYTGVCSTVWLAYGGCSLVQGEPDEVVAQLRAGAAEKGAR